ncbi:MAG TPA: NAD(P)H-dependent oxidoreductase [Flavobacteriaceae bacterium]|nr:NAD(P)H-dependent oxidoreductase [Ulvibacter sp.]HAH33358.1 NAD(P)H-dependent oxidoreductase [Flavobacteriaceae bacterium]|tara:strand:- start:1737 stop:2372 length:636 start_codon:yes stop_codon:yes gene_type:complete
MTCEIIDKLQWRYACKKFDNTKKLSEEKLTVLKQAFNLTATSYGLQPLKMLVISSQKLKKALVPLTHNQRQVADCSQVLVLCTETQISSHYIKEYFDTVVSLRETPRDVLQPFEDFLTNDFSKKDSSQINIWMAKQAYLALGNLLTVCALEDIDACPIEGFEPQKYDSFLNLTEKGLQSVLVLAVGYRADDDMFSTLTKVRRGTEKVIIEL